MITPAEPISTAASARSTAFVMAHATRTEAEYWLGLQVAFEPFQAKKKLTSELNALPALVSQSEDPELAMSHVSH